MMKRIIILVILLMCGSVFAVDWNIVGDSIFIEKDYASLRVTPHTAISPVGDYKQKFEVCNKTEAETNLYAAYLFDDALSAGFAEAVQRYGEYPIDLG